MREGDIVEWEGYNGTRRAIVARDDSGDLVCLFTDGRSIPLKDVRLSRSFKVIKQEK